MANKVARCCCCGQVLPLKLVLPRVKQRIYDYIVEHPGRNAEEIVNACWADDPNGGPTSYRSIVAVHVMQINKRLANYGLRIKGHTSYGYRLISQVNGRIGRL